MSIGKLLLNDKTSSQSRQKLVPPLRLRGYRPGDLARLCEIDRQCFAAGIAFPRDEMAAMVGGPSPVILLAETPAGRLAGFVLAHRRAAHAHLMTLDVLPSWRRRGLGRRLLLACERPLRPAGAATLYLETAVNNTAAQPLDAGLGYTRARHL